MPPGWSPTPGCEDQCSARGPALSHAKSATCQHNDGHDMCCHCRRRFRHSKQCRHWETDAGSQQAQTSYSQPMQQPREQHAFQFTMTGRCGRRNCNKVEGEHLRYFEAAVDGCRVDHLSVPTEHNGKGWTRCPSCSDMVEPVLIESELPGPLDALGRGEPSPRQISEWQRISKAWKGGYYLS